MYCSSCGIGVGQEASFCGSCGKPIQPLKSADDAKVSPSAPISPDAKQPTITSQGPSTGSESNGLATAALVLGILSAMFFEFVFVPIAALVVSAFALSKSTSLANKGQKKTGKGKSVAGLILGGVYLFVWFAWNVLGMGPGR